MPVDRQSQAVLDYMAKMERTPLHELTPAQARKNEMLVLEPGPAMSSVTDVSITGPGGKLDLRVYDPHGDDPKPTLLWFHGGGWVLGDLDMEDGTCRRIAARAGCKVVSVDYRLAPESKFPAAPEDCYAAASWVAANGWSIGLDGGVLAVGGDSAGGTLAAAVCLMARDRTGPPIRHQLMVCPVMDRDFSTPSYLECGDSFRPTTQLMRWFWRHYLEDPEDVSDPRAAPLRAGDFSDLPPATIITAEYDVLRSEGEEYAARLRDPGGQVTLTRYEGTIHFLVLLADRIDKGRRALDELARALAWIQVSGS